MFLPFYFTFFTLFLLMCSHCMNIAVFRILFLYFTLHSISFISQFMTMRIPNATSWKVHVIEANIDSFDTFMKENNRNHLYITKLQDFWFECEQKQKEIEKMFHEWVNAKKVNLRNEILQIEQNQQTDLVTQFQTMSTGTKLSKKRKFLQIENEKEDSRPNKKRKQNHINACNVNIQ